MSTLRHVSRNVRNTLLCVHQLLGYALAFLWALCCSRAALAARLLAAESQRAVFSAPWHRGAVLTAAESPAYGTQCGDHEQEDTAVDTPAGSIESVILHGVRVIPLGRITPAFRQALGRLARRGYADPDCAVVKTAAGPTSGITHEGGRYIHPQNPAAGEMLEALGARDVVALEPPFVVAPGPCTLYHEWGHHVDQVWSRDDQMVLFSFRWFSSFYAIEVRPRAELIPEQFGDAVRFAQAPREPSAFDWSRALPVWWQTSSAVFADLFEDWMRGGGKLKVDPCGPWGIKRRSPGGEPILHVEFLPGVDGEGCRRDITRQHAYALRGIATTGGFFLGLF